MSIYIHINMPLKRQKKTVLKLERLKSLKKQRF